MLTLVIGKHNQVKLLNTQAKKHGFTLLEILLVVVIVAVMSVVGANVINSQSVERTILNQAKAFEQNLIFLCEKAVLDNQALGIEFSQLGYNVFGYQQQTWQMLEPDELPVMAESVSMALLLGGLEQSLPAEPEGLPQIVCQPDGSFNAFEIRLAAKEQATHYYALSTVSPWELDTEWHAQE